MAVKKEFTVIFSLVLGALTIRLASLFFVTPIDFFWESYHYWQIAFYTLRVGVSQGRMWDLGGMEYFWGPLPILVQSFLMWILNTTSILPFRVLDTVLGSTTVFLAYLVGKRHFDERVGILSAAMVMLNPLLIFNSVVGMEETMGLFFVMLALSLWHKNGYLMGISLGLASLCRIEYWLLTFGILFIRLLFERDLTTFITPLIGWLTPMGPYFLHVRGATGDPFYAFYWNFIGNIAGAWTPWYISPTVRGLFALTLVVAVVGLLLLYRHRERVSGYVVYAVLFGFAAYHGLVYTLSGVAPLFDRFFLLDAAVGSILLARVIFQLPKMKMGSVHLGRILSPRFPKVVGLGACLLLGLSFSYVVPYYVHQQSDIIGLYYVADQLGGNYTGGTVLCNMPMMVYRLIDHWHLSHENILGTLYCPLDNLTEALAWLKRHNATWLVVAEPKAQHMLAFFGQYPLTRDLFIWFFGYSGAALYRVNRTLIEAL